MGGVVPPPGASARNIRFDVYAGHAWAHAGYRGFRAQPRAARIRRATLAISQPPRLRLAHRGREREGKGICKPPLAHRPGYRRRTLDHARDLGRRIRLWRPGRAEKSYAPDFPRACGTCLGRTASSRLLATGATQRARHRRARLEHARGNARLLGGRDGAHPMDARSLAQRRRRL